MRIALLLSVAVVVIACVAQDLSAQGYYHRTARRNPLTGRQQIVDLHPPRWTGSGQGGYMFDAGSGSLQVTAIRRDRATGRLEYHNEYVNHWTGARYTTSTQFNPYTKRYQTQRDFAPPTNDRFAARKREAPKVIESLPRTPRRPRIIETKTELEEAPAEINPVLLEPAVTPAAESSQSDQETATPEPTPEPAVTIEIRSP